MDRMNEPASGVSDPRTTPNGGDFEAFFHAEHERVLRADPWPDLFEAVDDRDVVARALARLSERQRAALVLIDLLDFDSEGAARILGIKAATVRALASQGRAALRKTAEQLDE